MIDFTGNFIWAKKIAAFFVYYKELTEKKFSAGFFRI